MSATSGLRRVRERARANVLLDNLWRVGVAISGLLVVALGLVLVPLPGPGWAIVAVGVLIWATEFKWARGVLDRLRFALSTSKKVVTHPRLRLFWNIFSLVLGIAFIVMLTWYLVEFGFSLDGVSAFQGWVIDRVSDSRWGSIFGFSGD